MWMMLNIKTIVVWIVTPCGLVDGCQCFGGVSLYDIPGDLYLQSSYPPAVVYPGIFFRGGGRVQIQVRTEDRENRDLGAAAPYSGVLEAAVIWYKKFHFI
jgi:hypothetical protein